MCDLQELYEKVVSVTNKTTEDLVGYKKRKATALLCEERRKLRKKISTTLKNQLLRGQYKIKNRACKAGVKREKRTLLQNEIIQMEEEFKSNRSHNLFKTIRNLEKKIKEKAYHYEGKR